METKAYYRLLIILITCAVFLSFDAHATPYRAEAKPAEAIRSAKKIDFKAIEQRLGRKLKWREKFVLRRFKKQLKRQKAREKKKRVRIILKDKNFKTVQGNITRIENDSVYLINYSSKGAIQNKHEQELVIPVSRIKTIKLLNYDRRAKKRKAWMVAAAVLLFLSFGTFLIGNGRAKRSNGQTQAGLGETLLGIYGMIIAVIILLFNLIFSKKNDLDLDIHNVITPEQIELLTPYIIP